MATVNVEINGRHYMVGCADGQEERVRLLARQFDENVRQVADDVGAVGELRLFLMAALLVSDELAEIRAQYNRMRVDFGTGPDRRRSRPAERARPLRPRSRTIAAPSRP